LSHNKACGLARALEDRAVHLGQETAANIVRRSVPIYDASVRVKSIMKRPAKKFNLLRFIRSSVKACGFKAIFIPQTLIEGI
jgi:hypothetical protein